MTDEWKVSILVGSALVVLLVLVFGNAWSHAGADAALIDEMRQARKQKAPRATQVDLTEVAKKHLPIGTTKETALAVCRQSGFKIIMGKDMKRKPPAGFDESIVCKIMENKGWRWSFLAADEYVVVFHLKEDRIGMVYGDYSFVAP